MTKALLMLTGGRGIPDMLVVKYLRPDITLTLTTDQGLGSAKHLQHLVASKFGGKLEILPTINPYDEQEIKIACEKAIQLYPDAEWHMNITSAPKIVSIFAMDVAREKSIPCWFLNTSGGEVISLAKNIPIDQNKVFSATVEEYMDVYQRRYAIPKPKAYREKAQDWYNIAQTLTHHPESTHVFLGELRRAQKGKSQSESVSLNVDIRMRPLIEQLATSPLNVLSIDTKTDKTLECTVSDGEKREFLSGDWLEVYVWKEVEKAGFVQDHQWGYQVYHKEDVYELDLALTTRGLLFIAECKTDYDPFTRKSTYLDTIDANANLLGGAYVSKFFISSHPNPQAVQSYQSFYQQAIQKKIRVLSAKDLSDIGNILRSEVAQPTFSRI